eukprot:Nk52_evm10s2473 gene=Nk52_evmTU10s2473
MLMMEGKNSCVGENEDSPSVAGAVASNTTVTKEQEELKSVEVVGGKGGEDEKEREGLEEEEDNSAESKEAMIGKVDSFLLTVLNSPKDRITLLKLEDDFKRFLGDASQNKLEFPPMTSYHRLIVHRSAQFFGLDHVVDPSGRCVHVYKSEICTVPALVFSDYIEEEEPKPPQKVKIMRRNENASKKEADVGNIGALKDEKKTVMTIEEREKAYKEARARIFQGGENEEESDSGDGRGVEEQQQVNLKYSVLEDTSSYTKEYSRDEYRRNHVYYPPRQQQHHIPLQQHHGHSQYNPYVYNNAMYYPPVNQQAKFSFSQHQYQPHNQQPHHQSHHHHLHHHQYHHHHQQQRAHQQNQTQFWRSSYAVPPTARSRPPPTSSMTDDREVSSQMRDMRISQSSRRKPKHVYSQSGSLSHYNGNVRNPSHILEIYDVKATSAATTTATTTPSSSSKIADPKAMFSDLIKYGATIKMLKSDNANAPSRILAVFKNSAQARNALVNFSNGNFKLRVWEITFAPSIEVPPAGVSSPPTSAQSSTPSTPPPPASTGSDGL